jgi:hypothetical protein
MFTDFANIVSHRYKSEKSLTKWSSESKRKILFHIVCEQILRDDYDEKTINQEVPYGSRIGMGNSYLDVVLSKVKIFRLHAAFHDALGHCKMKYDKGPGYSYIFHLPINSCFLGHVTGLLYWLYSFFFQRRLYNRLDI